MCKSGDTFSWAEILFYSWDVIGYIIQKMLIILMKIKGSNWTLENYEFVNVHMKVTQKVILIKHLYFWFAKIHYIPDKLTFLHLMI